MVHNIFKGLGIALITPFLEDGSVDYKSLIRLVQYQLDNGADFFCILATTGETPTLTQDEKQKIKNLIVDLVGGRVPILMGCGGNNTAAVINELQTGDFRGIDGILSVCPYYNKPSQEGLYQHFKAIAAATKLPVVLYNVPGRTSCNLEAATTLRIAEECPNVVGIKEASGMMKQILQLLAKRPDGFLVISGDDLLTLPLMAAGADGLISVMANAFPKKVADMVHHIMRQELDEARAIHQQLVPLTIDCFKEGSPAGVKAIMSAMDLIDNALRLPLVPVSDKLQEEIVGLLRFLEQISLIFADLRENNLR